MVREEEEGMKLFCKKCKKETTWKYTGLGVAMRCLKCERVELATVAVEEAE